MRSKFPGPDYDILCELALPIRSIPNVQTTASSDNETSSAFLEHLEHLEHKEDAVAMVDSNDV